MQGGDKCIAAACAQQISFSIGCGVCKSNTYVRIYMYYDMYISIQNILRKKIYSVI